MCGSDRASIKVCVYVCVDRFGNPHKHLKKDILNTSHELKGKCNIGPLVHISGDPFFIKT